MSRALLARNTLNPTPWPLRPGERVELVVRGLHVVAVGRLAAVDDELLQVLASTLFLVVAVRLVEPVGVGHAAVVEGVVQLGIEVDGLLELRRRLLVLLEVLERQAVPVMALPVV